MIFVLGKSGFGFPWQWHWRGQIGGSNVRGIAPAVVPSYRGDGRNLPKPYDFYGAGDGIRTRDVQLGKLAFYH